MNSGRFEIHCQGYSWWDSCATSTSLKKKYHFLKCFLWTNHSRPKCAGELWKTRLMSHGDSEKNFGTERHRGSGCFVSVHAALFRDALWTPRMSGWNNQVLFWLAQITWVCVWCFWNHCRFTWCPGSQPQTSVDQINPADIKGSNASDALYSFHVIFPNRHKHLFFKLDNIVNAPLSGMRALWGSQDGK